MSTVSVFGLGYVGCVSAACLAKDGHNVIGVDVNPSKIEAIQRGRPTVLEVGLNEVVARACAEGRLTATLDAATAIKRSSMSVVCVGTPSRPNGSVDLAHVQNACREIGEALRDISERHTVVVRSTVIPGTTEGSLAPILADASGRSIGPDLGIGFNPEFLREGTSLRDYYSAPFTVIGTTDPLVGNEVGTLYAATGAPVHVVAPGVAEMLKYASNAFHGLKIGFANEVGNLSKALGIDSHDVMRLLCEDRKLNISPAYLKPGFAFGGSCLPKDLRAVLYQAKQADVEMPMLTGLLESNRRQVIKALDMVLATGLKRVGILGMSFKAGTDDLRESPMVALIERLIGKGLELQIFDRDVSRANLFGSNRDYIEREIPHIWSLVRESIEDVLDSSDVIVVGNATPEFAGIETRLRENQRIIDLVRVFGARVSDGGPYEGICW